MSPPTSPTEDASDTEDEDRTGSRTRSSTTSRSPLPFTEKHRLLKLKLLPLRSVQSDIQNRLGLRDYPTPPSEPDADTPSSISKPRSHELFVWSHAAWKAALRPASERRSLDAKSGAARKASEEAETSEILASCREDIQALWQDEVVQEMLRRRRLRLDLLPGLCAVLNFLYVCVAFADKYA